MTSLCASLPPPPPPPPPPPHPIIKRTAAIARDALTRSASSVHAESGRRREPSDCHAPVRSPDSGESIESCCGGGAGSVRSSSPSPRLPPAHPVVEGRELREGGVDDEEVGGVCLRELHKGRDGVDGGAAGAREGEAACRMRKGTGQERGE